MRDLQDIIHDCFGDSGHTRKYGSNREPSTKGKEAYLVIPVKDTFELPVFAIKALKPDIDYMAISLQDVGVKTSYKSLDSGTRDILTMDFPNNRLVELPKKAGEQTYYGTYGAIFDKNFCPMMMILWEMKRIVSDEINYPYAHKYQFVKPILRVSPHVFINKGTTVERYIINKIVSSAVQNFNVYRPSGLGRFLETTNYTAYQMKVEIGGFQSMYLKRPDVPSISTTNEKLLKVVLGNIEETVE